MKYTREEKRKFGIFRLVNSFKYSIDGLKYALVHEQNLVIHFIIAFLVVLVGFLFHLELFEWVILLFAIGSVISAELLNSALEATVDLITEEKKKNAKIAKDIGSTSVLLFAIAAAIIGVLIFLQKLIALF